MSTPYITFGGDQIPFELRAKRLQSNRITIKIKPDCQVIVSAPRSATHEEIIIAVNKQARWVYNKLQVFKTQQEQITPRQYINGESHYYLGEKYLLKVSDDVGAKPHVKLVDDELHLITSRGIEHKRKLLLDWYKHQALDIFNRRLEQILPTVPWVKEYPLMRLRSMRARWGSCSIKGKITLNTHLVKAPMACIDYVILHELCHIAEHNHSKKFYRLLTQVNPHWKEAKHYLHKTAHLYLAQ